MSRLALVRFSSALPLLALLACKIGRDDEQGSRPLPTPEPASTTPSTKPEVEQLRDPRAKPATPRRPADESPASPPPASPTPTATATATATTTTAPTATGTADAAAPAPSDAGAAASGADKLNQCIAKCQASLSGCLTKPVPLDAGVPSLESMAECKKAFEDCRTACS
jgi:cytoskeletal protein RodZ